MGEWKVRNEFLDQIKLIADVMYHKSSPKNYDEAIHKPVNHYAGHISSLSIELDNTMFTKTELDIILKLIVEYMAWGIQEEKNIKSIKRKINKLSKMARVTRNERV